MTLDDGRDLVREVVGRLDRGGTDADDAAVMLGLLIERERFARRPGTYHGPALDEAIAEMYGNAVAIKRLSPLAVHEAVSALLDHLRRIGIPSVAVVSALAKSYEPRVVPHLYALLEQIVDKPEHDGLASQIVSTLVLFPDATAVAGIRLAATRGHGDARRVAEQWIALHGDKELAPRAAQRHLPISVIALGGETYLLQRRPGSREVITSCGGGTLRIIDPARPEAARTLSLGYSDQRTMRAWCLRADGSEAVVFSDHGDACSLVSLAAGTVRDVPLPTLAPTDSTEHLRYLWEDDRLLVSWSLVSSFHGLRREPLGFEQLRSMFVRRDARDWVAVLDQLPPLQSRVMRIEADEARLLAYEFGRAPGHLVAGSWRNRGEPIRIPTPMYVPDLACDGARMFLLYDHEVQAVDRSGGVIDIYPAPAGTYLRALDTLPARVGEPGLLVVAASPLTDTSTTQLLVFRLEA